jgi:DNA-binding GntR family transcriptional regulator
MMPRVLTVGLKAEKRNHNMNYEIYQTILDRILFFEYPPGQILNENILAEEFGVSRTPLREVLNRLEWEQLVRIVPRTGTIVADIEFQKMTHVFQIRLEIEELAGRLAGEHVTDDHLDKMDKVRQECEQLFDSRNQRSLIKVDFKFRDALYDAANNPVLKDISQYLYNLTIRLSYILFQRGDWAEQVRTSFDEYNQIYEALSRRDSQQAGTLRGEWLKTHIERIKNKF